MVKLDAGYWSSNTKGGCAKSFFFFFPPLQEMKERDLFSVLQKIRIEVSKESNDLVGFGSKGKSWEGKVTSWKASSLDGASPGSSDYRSHCTLEGSSTPLLWVQDTEVILSAWSLQSIRPDIPITLGLRVSSFPLQGPDFSLHSAMGREFTLLLSSATLTIGPLWWLGL